MKEAAMEHTDIQNHISNDTKPHELRTKLLQLVDMLQPLEEQLI